MFRSVTGWVLAFLLAASSAPAATVRGNVTGWDGQSLGGARVTLVNGDSSIVLETRSTSLGNYKFDGVPSGPWVVGASRPGYAYRESLRVIGTGLVFQYFVLGPDDHPGRWTTIGNTDPENLYGTNSGSLLPDGRIFLCHNTVDPLLFDPVTGTKTFPQGSSMFQGCHVPSHLPDGRLIIIGGQESHDQNDATRMVKAFDPATETWEELPLLNQERWYPGLARLGDGRLLVMGGGQHPNLQRTPTCEIYDPVAQTWTVAASMSNPSDYPPAVLLGNGMVLRTWWPPQLYNVPLDQWTNAGPMVQPDRSWPDRCDHSLFRLADGRACAVGIYRGSLTSPSMIELYNPTTNTWSLGANASVTRSLPEAALLPTGQILAAGGKLEDDAPSVSTNTWGYTRLTDLYDATTNTWRRCADMAWHREHHATTMLVPDGRVITTAGTGEPGLPGVSNDIEAFEPPYLFRGIRPRIDTISQTLLHHGLNVTMSVSRTAAVTRLVLVGMGAVTHWVDGGLPMVIPLSFAQAGPSVQAVIPADFNIAPAGFYMLFALVDDIPSEGLVVQVSDSLTVSAPPPTLPGSLTASASPNPFAASVRLRWYQPEAARAEVRIHDVAGRTVFDRAVAGGPGWLELEWDGRSADGNVRNGVYFLHLKAGSLTWRGRAVRLGG